ncbi:mucin-3A-like isoform X3 [Ascaphus truei]|uniref:mucin-3A-like isoform X3 n=1 Tax=Ascaphus truei TaxID=8439 RepID=UPI003F5A2390
MILVPCGKLPQMILLNTCRGRDCQNGGYYDGIKCICNENYIGPLCEYFAGRCENGGYFDGSKCDCARGYTGPTCQFAEDTITIDKVDTTVKVEVKISSRTFTEELTDVNTPEYKDFVREFNLQMKGIYSQVSGFKDIKIIQIRNGSIVVDHDVIVETDYKSNITEEYQTIYQNITHSLNRAAQSTLECNSSTFLCFDANATKVTEMEVNFDPAEWCKSVSPPENANYYYPYTSDKGLICVTNCTEGILGTMNCHYGQCRVLPKSGPSCECHDTTDFWYSGQTCDTRISRPGVIGGVTAAACILIIIFIIALIIFQRRRGKWNIFTKSRFAGYDSWVDEESPWFSSETFIVKNPNARGHEGINPGLSKEYFRPNLETVDTNLKIQTKRPERVVSKAD